MSRALPAAATEDHPPSGGVTSGGHSLVLAHCQTAVAPFVTQTQ